MGYLLYIKGPVSHVYGTFSLAPYRKLENNENSLTCYTVCKDIAYSSLRQECFQDVVPVMSSWFQLQLEIPSGLKGRITQ